MNLYPNPVPLYSWTVISFYTRLPDHLKGGVGLAQVFNVTLVY